MESHVIDIFKKCGLLISNNTVVDGQEINRDAFLSHEKYVDIQENIPLLKLNLSSSSLTCLQSKAETKQKWPLLNLARQLLRFYNFKMVPKRKCLGKGIDGVKRYVRYFRIVLETNDKTNKYI